MEEIPGGTWHEYMEELNETQKKQFKKIVITFNEALGTTGPDKLKNSLREADLVTKQAFFKSTFTNLIDITFDVQ